mgnify:CR=1 FL=1
MAKIQQISELTPSFAFTEYDFYKEYEESFKKSELGHVYSLLPLHEMAVRFGLIDSVLRKKAGRKSYFSPDGIKSSVEALKAAGFNAHGFISEGTAHEFLTWRRSLKEFLPLIF